MKIVVLTGSPHRQGTSALLADEFIAGAVSKGHAIVRFDTAFEKVGPCRACYHCDRHDGECIQKDAMRKILPEILSADMIVLVTPLYYFNMTAQLKTVLDRLMPQRAALRKHPMKSAMLVTCGSNTDWNMDAIMANYKLSFHVQIDLFKFIIFYISICYLKSVIQRSPKNAPCIPLFSGYYSGYPYKLAFQDVII
ncbi:flavodoxin family protein [uncultured Bilophila sp.]|uniref:flavodoxin family protein n=1 Tax=uncultured Bilophila sp. TaxID=529385 RepID=UPI00280A4E5D|nr:flavodoxin family protein [uncultured Bilophila sp.]